MYKSLLSGLLVTVITPSLFAKEIEIKKGKLLLEESFEKEVSPKVFKGGIGEWKIANGILHGTELAKDNHPAASRVYQPTQDAVYEFKFRLTKEGQSFNCGFDPAKGELDKKGHLWSVSIAGSKWRLAKAPDKAKPKEDPAKTLDQGDISIEKDKWYTMKIICLGNKVSVTVGDKILAAEHGYFHVKKPALIFRCKGDGVEIDDVKIWEVSK